MLELVSPCPGSLSLLAWDGSNSTVSDCIHLGGKVYKPCQLDPSPLRAIPLPSEATPYGSTRKLVDSISSLFQRYTSVSATTSILLSIFVLATWFADILPSAPCVVLLGSEAREAARILRLLGLLVRRGLILRAIAPAGLCSLPLELNPTVLVDVRRLSKKMWDLFRASGTPDSYVSLSGRLAKLYFARAMYVDGSSCRRELGGTVEVTVSASPNNLALLDAKAKREILDEFQNQLLCYRLRNLGAVSEAKIDTKEFGRELADQAAIFAASIVDEVMLRQEVLALLGPQDQHVRAERSTGLHAAVIETLLVFCHENQAEAHVREIAKLTNEVRIDRESRPDVEARKVGAILGDLGLFTTRLDRSGRGIMFLPETRAHIHRLAREYEVASLATPFPGCKECTEGREEQVN